MASADKLLERRVGIGGGMNTLHISGTYSATSSLTTRICPETLIFLNTELRRMTGINDGNNNTTVSTSGFLK